MRLDVCLMHGGGLEFVFDHDVGFLKAGVHVAHGEFQDFGDVGRLGRRRFHTAGDHVLEQQRGVGGHRFIDVDDVRQHLVFDLDQGDRLFGDGVADRGDGGDGMAFVIDLLARHDVARDVPEVHRDAFRPDVVEFLRRQVGGGHDRLHTGQLLGGGGVDRQDFGVRVRAAQDLAVDHARELQVGAVHRAARDFGDTVRPDRARAHPFETLHGIGDDGGVVHGGLAMESETIGLMAHRRSAGG